jgi:hypothetical protein
MVTATTALRLVDRGDLRLDQPLIKILPPEHRTRAMTPGHTLHHLLSHTSGLPNYHDDAAQTWDSFVGAWIGSRGARPGGRPTGMRPIPRLLRRTASAQFRSSYPTRVSPIRLTQGGTARGSRGLHASGRAECSRLGPGWSELMDRLSDRARGPTRRRCRW